MKTFGLQDKYVLVTGVSGFLGRHLHRSLVGEGAHVLGIDVNNTMISRDIDITNESQVAKYVSEQCNAKCKIHGLVNNAAISYKGKYISEQQFDDTITTNINGTYNMINGLKSVLDDNASVVNISSIYGQIVPDFGIYENNENEFNNVSYGCSKAAIEYMTKYYTKLYAPMRFNCVAPGGIWNNHSDDFVSKYSRRTPLKRMADVEEIINAILFLLSPLSSYISGVILPVDGGRLID